MNIETRGQNHRRYCHQPDDEYIYSVGDVRVCNHGRRQVGYEVMGCAAPYWRDLSWFWTPVQWWRARRAFTQELSFEFPPRYADLEPPAMTLDSPTQRKEL